MGVRWKISITMDSPEVKNLGLTSRLLFNRMNYLNTRCIHNEKETVAHVVVVKLPGQKLHQYKETFHFLFLPSFTCTRFNFFAPHCHFWRQLEVHAAARSQYTVVMYEMHLAWGLGCGVIFFKGMEPCIHFTLESLLKLKVALDWGRIVSLGL